MRRSLVVLGVLAATAAAGAPRAAAQLPPSPRVLVVPTNVGAQSETAYDPRVEPRRMLLSPGQGDGSETIVYRLSRLHWTTWGRRTARASGRGGVSCEGCPAGAGRARVSLSRPHQMQQCGQAEPGRRAFTRAVVTVRVAGRTLRSRPLRLATADDC